MEQLKPDIELSLSKPNNKLIVALSTLISLLAIAACDGKKAPPPENKPDINEYEDFVSIDRESHNKSQRLVNQAQLEDAQDYDAIKEVLSIEADNFFNTAAKLQPLVKLLRKNPWIIAKIKQNLKRTEKEVERLKEDPKNGSSFTVSINSKFNVEITADPYNFLNNGGGFIMFRIIDKKGKPVLQLFIENETNCQEISLADWLKKTFSNKCEHRPGEGPFRVEFEAVGIKHKEKIGIISFADFELQKKIDDLHDAGHDLDEERVKNLTEHLPPEIVQILRLLKMANDFLPEHLR
ncbi:hypothetical protein ACFL3T_01720 [Patescibacteria group bacterium]